MKVIRARVSGFCMGVRRAVNMALVAVSPGTPVYTLGPLIHNPRVIDGLERRGIRSLEEGVVLPESAKVIIRAHGISPEAEDELRRRKVSVIDATCPKVKASQRIARDFVRRGYWLFLAGEENHGEITGIRGYADLSGQGVSACFIVGSPEEAGIAAERLFGLEPQGKTALIGQTTISPEEYKAIGESIGRFFPNLEIINTICGATTDRQEALRELCAQVDAVVIAGGRESANTRRLLSLAQELGKPCWLAETPADLPREINAYEIVGLSAGASAPDSQITGIEAALENL